MDNSKGEKFVPDSKCSLRVNYILKPLKSTWFLPSTYTSLLSGTNTHRHVQTQTLSVPTHTRVRTQILPTHTHTHYNAFTSPSLPLLKLFRTAAGIPPILSSLPDVSHTICKRSTLFPRISCRYRDVYGV